MFHTEYINALGATMHYKPAQEVIAIKYDISWLYKKNPERLINALAMCSVDALAIGSSPEAIQRVLSANRDTPDKQLLQLLPPIELPRRGLTVAPQSDLPDGAAGCINCTGLYLISPSDRAACVAEMCRITKPGGTITICDYDVARGEDLALLRVLHSSESPVHQSLMSDWVQLFEERMTVEASGPTGPLKEYVLKCTI